MTTQELIEKIANLDRVYGEKYYVALEDVLDLVKQLDEPQKVKVSEEEAKFLKTFDFNRENDVATALYHVSRTGWGYELTDRDGTELKHLTREARLLKNRERLIKAILDGYEVEEKRYLVKVKGFDEYDCYLNKGLLSKKYFLESKAEIGGCRTKHTCKELEADGFGWVFDCEGIEIEEVE